MKKILSMGASMLLAFTMTAQTTAVKEINNRFKGNSAAAAQALKDIQPYLTGDETKNDAATWIVAAKAGIGTYDHTYTQATIGTTPDANGKKTAGNALSSAYDYLFTAIPLDQVTDKNGKIKSKNLKEIVKLLKDNYQSLKQAGIWLYEAQDYAGAVKAWEHYVTLPGQACMAGSGLQADPDTIVGQLINYQALALLLNKQPKEALEASRRVGPTGFDDIEVYRYGLAAAQELGDTAAMEEFANKGYVKYAAQDPDLTFLGTLINIKLATNDYAAAGNLVDKAIEVAVAAGNTEQLANLYNLKGTIAEQGKDLANAEKYFNLAVDTKPDFAKGIFDKARMIYNKALEMDNDADDAARRSTINPMFMQAAEMFEQAYDLDEINMSQIPGILYRLFYRLEGEGGVNTTKWEALK